MLSSNPQNVALVNVAPHSRKGIAEAEIDATHALHELTRAVHVHQAAWQARIDQSFHGVEAALVLLAKPGGPERRALLGQELRADTPHLRWGNGDHWPRTGGCWGVWPGIEKEA